MRFVHCQHAFASLSRLRDAIRRQRGARRSSTLRCLSVEGLESRQLLAADALAVATELAVSLNRVRCAPASFEAAHPEEWRSLTYAQPLAINSQLRTAAQSHAASMAIGGFFGHHDPTSGSDPNGRIREAGYALPSRLSDEDNGGEIIAGGHQLDDPQSVLKELLDDASDPDRSRRKALLSADAVLPEHTEIGVAWSYGPATALENYWVIEMAAQHAGDRFLTGVVYDDVNANDRFDAGEGLAGIRVHSGALATTTDPSGAYRLAVGAGVHRVQIAGDAEFQADEQLVRVAADNVEVDFVAGQLPQVNFRHRSLWTNPLEHLDANRSGAVEPLDALVILNRLNREGSGPLPATPDASASMLYDTNGDALATPIDALIVINRLNRPSN